jgi:hypothetical protein
MKRFIFTQNASLLADEKQPADMNFVVLPASSALPECCYGPIDKDPAIVCLDGFHPIDPVTMAITYDQPAMYASICCKIDDACKNLEALDCSKPFISNVVDVLKNAIYDCIYLSGTEIERALERISEIWTADLDSFSSIFLLLYLLEEGKNGINFKGLFDCLPVMSSLGARYDFLNSIGVKYHEVKKFMEKCESLNYDFNAHCVDRIVDYEITLHYLNVVSATDERCVFFNELGIALRNHLTGILDDLCTVLSETGFLNL